MMHKIKEKSSTFFRSLKWQDYAFAGLLIIFIVINTGILHDLKELPSPLYGGDVYNHLGSMEHIAQGGSLFENGQMIGEIQWVPWLYHLFVVIFSKITGLDLLHAVMYFSLVAMAVSLVTVYIFISKLFSNKYYGLLAALFMGLVFPIYKYSHFSFYVMLPLFFFAMYNFMKKEDWKSAIIAGIVFGLTGLSNTHAFIVAVLFIAVFFIYHVIIKPISKNENKIRIDKKKLLINFKKAATIFIIGFLIALLWWYKPIFVYHGQTPNDLQIYGFPVMTTFSEMIGVVTGSIQNTFFSFTNIYYSIIGIGAILGIISLFFIKNKKTEHHFLMIGIIAALAGLLSHFVTMPLFHNNIVPGMIFDAFMRVLILLFFIFFLSVVFHYTDKVSKHIKLIIIIIIGVITIITLINYRNGFSKDQWYTNAKEPFPTYLEDANAWVLANTKLDDVFLTNNEDGFVLNGFTGRKMVTYRRTHAPLYTDMNQRMLDAAIILYGNNDNLRNELIKKYDVKYLYWTPRWLQNEFQIDDKGQVTGFFDPLMIDYTPERESILTANNISHIRTSYYLDPAWLPTYPKRDVLVIFPSRPNFQTPWSSDLDRYLKPQKEFLYNGQAYARIYSIVQP